jgi:membrane-bound lytic murein transglycosylase A
MAASASAVSNPADFQLRLASFAALPGFAAEDHLAAFAVFRRSCKAIVAVTPDLRPARPPSPGLVAICGRALAADIATGPAAKAFFERHFRPWRIVPRSDEGIAARGFLTAYYEPQVPASRERTADFTAPIYGRPPDLATFAPGETPLDLPDGLAAARRRPDGSHEPYPDRAAIETGALAGLAEPIAWLADRTEAFLIHVQGSARLTFEDGTSARLTYAGRNGQPYTSIGRILVETGQIGAGEMSLARLKSWIRAHGQSEGDAGTALMRRNRSFIFFSLRPSDEDGPIGAENVPLAPLRSIAIDRNIWCYGLPFLIAADLPRADGEMMRFEKLMIAQDTGSAILGAARADLFFGSGEEAGAWAGNIRHAGDFFVFLPEGEGPP